MNPVAGALAFLLLMLSVGSGFFVVSRACRGASLWPYIPLMIELSLALLLFGFAVLPQGFPSLFQTVLGHSILSDYTYTRASDGVSVTETWILARWWRPISTLFGLVIPVGLFWSVWNLREKGTRVPNAVALALGFFWVTAILWMHLVSFLF